MNELIVKETMTLKEITDLLNVQHSKAMVTIAKMAKNPDFGAVSILDVAYNEQGQTIETYKLDKRQSIAAASKLNTSLLMKVIDRWQELESPVHLSPAEQLLANAQRLVDHERQLKELEYQQHETSCQVKALVDGEDYFTIVGYTNITNRNVNQKEANALGRQAAKLCREREWSIGEAPHPVFGKCGAYPREALEIIFGD